MTIKDATMKWVSEFNAIPMSLIEKAYWNCLEEIREITCDRDEVEYDTIFPMWGTMWTFGDACDDWWLDDEDHRQAMSDCGFRIYECDELGYVFGIDGAGYDFYEGHWIPLYKTRGLQWHKR